MLGRRRGRDGVALSWSWTCLRRETWIEVTQIIKRKGEVEGLEKSSCVGPGARKAAAQSQHGGGGVAREGRRFSEVEGGLW